MADRSEERLKQLEDRVAALEKKLGLAGPEQPAAVPAAVAAVGDVAPEAA